MTLESRIRRLEQSGVDPEDLPIRLVGIQITTEGKREVAKVSIQGEDPQIITRHADESEGDFARRVCWIKAGGKAACAGLFTDFGAAVAAGNPEWARRHVLSGGTNTDFVAELLDHVAMTSMRIGVDHKSLLTS